jgi:hypothetical protein
VLAVIAFSLHLPQTVSAGRRHGYPPWWRREAACVRWHESRGRWHIQTGNGYYGAYQFLLSTWASVAVRGWPSNPAAASPAQQTFAVWRVWIRDGRSWREWGTAGVCGLS